MNDDTNHDDGMDGVDLPAPGERVGTFYGSCNKFTVNRHGDLLITVVVPAEHKYEALPVTDYPGLLLEFDVARVMKVYGDYTSTNHTDDGDDADAEWGVA